MAPRAVIDDAERGVKIVISGDGNRVAVDSAVLGMYEEEAVRKSLGTLARPVSRVGVDSLSIRKDNKEINVVRKEHLPSPAGFDVPTSIAGGADVLEDTREAVLRVSRANFENGKWGFSDGAAKFSADIQDEDFKERLDSREIGFYKGDYLRVLLRTTQIVSPNQGPPSTKYVIEKVIQHSHPLRQESLIPAPRDPQKQIEPPG